MIFLASSRSHRAGGRQLLGGDLVQLQPLLHFLALFRSAGVEYVDTITTGTAMAIASNKIPSVFLMRSPFTSFSDRGTLSATPLSHPGPFLSALKVV